MPLTSLHRVSLTLALVKIYFFCPPWTSDHGTSCPSPTPLLLTSGGHHWRPVQTCSPEIPIPSGVTSGGGHWSTYGFKWAVRILLECFLGFLPTSREGNVFRSVCQSVNHSVHRGSGLPNPPYWHLVAATAAVGTHPTRMHSFLHFLSSTQHAGSDHPRSWVRDCDRCRQKHHVPAFSIRDERKFSLFGLWQNVFLENFILQLVLVVRIHFIMVLKWFVRRWQWRIKKKRDKNTIQRPKQNYRIK